MLNRKFPAPPRARKAEDIFWGITTGIGFTKDSIPFQGAGSASFEDFQAFVDATDNNEHKIQRQQWIEALQKGEKPFTPEVLEQLR